MPSKVGEKERGMERNLGATIQRRLQAEGEKKKKERQKASMLAWKQMLSSALRARGPLCF